MAPVQQQQHYKDWPNEAGFQASIISNDVRTPIALHVEGRFPDYVAGSLYRTGPGAYKIPSSGSKGGVYTLRHWFDGFTSTHKFDLVRGEDGTCSQVFYSSLMQVEKLVDNIEKNGSPGNHVTFGQRDPCESLYRKVKSFFKPTDTQDPRSFNIGVTLRAPLPSEIASLDAKEIVGRQLLTITTDNPSVKHIDAETLEPIKVTPQATIHPSLTGQMSAAHAAEDPVTGDIFNYNLTLGPTPSYRVFRAARDGTVEVLAEIKGLGVRGAYLHSLFLTDNFVVLCVWPAYFRYMGISILWQRNIADSIGYEPNSDAVWYVIDRKNGRGVVNQFKSPSFFCFHTVNAWEEKMSDGTVDIICELCELPDTQCLELLEYQYIVSTEAVTSRAVKDRDFAANLVRQRLKNISTGDKPGKSAARTEKYMSIQAGDLPCINHKYALQPHRYVYTLLNRGKSSFLDGIGKTDMQSGTTIIWEKARHTPGEPIFVPRPGATEEDDGVILSVILDGDEAKSYLICLDAKNLEEIGRAAVDRPVGFGFHGLHVPASCHL